MCSVVSKVFTCSMDLELLNLFGSILARVPTTGTNNGCQQRVPTAGATPVGLLLVEVRGGSVQGFQEDMNLEFMINK